MVKNYVEHTIKQKRRYIYLEKWRWTYVLFFLIVFAFGNQLRYEEYSDFPMINSTLSLALTFFCYLSVLFYAIPVFLKKQKYRQFILYTVAIIFIPTLIETMCNYYLIDDSKSLSDVMLESLIYNFSVFTNTTSFAFFIETLDEISLRKESKKDLQILKDSQRKLAGTHVDLTYMLDNLSVIKNNMKNQSHEDDSMYSEQLLLLSDILRYRLYGHDNETIAVVDEIDIIDKMILQKNHIYTQNNLKEIDWSHEIKDHHLNIHKYCLVNTLSILIDSQLESENSNKILYLLVENNAANLFVEIENISKEHAEDIENNITKVISKYNIDNTINSEYSENKVIYNITYQLWKKSIA